ncbi:MAG: hypothetical protein HY301_09430 [Verrucomicrobia bacterium]|nr:hypothetical protein [Verrucomicrobiota bacterium]
MPSLASPAARRFAALLLGVLSLFPPLRAPAATFTLTGIASGGSLTWANAFTNGVCNVQSAAAPGGAWFSLQSYFTTAPGGSVPLVFPVTNQFYYRVRAVDISTNFPQGFTNLTQSYGALSTVAGIGLAGTDTVNYWDDAFEGGPATNAQLSRPHMAQADDAGNIYIVDKDSDSVLKVTPDGLLHTVAGTHTLGFNGDGPAPATTLEMSSPNGLWVRGDGTFYVLDKDNGKVRKVDTSGVMTTMFTTSNSNISQGRGLWVKADESLVYFCAGTRVRKWTAATGVTNVATGFAELGNLAISPAGKLYVTDRVGNLVYQVNDDGTGTKTIVAGTGGTTGGGDGFAALSTGLYGVRGIWFLPSGAYFLATHEGCQVWYVDPAGIIHLFVDGSHNSHSGDGAWFHSAGKKISEARSVTLDRNGNLIICEHDNGFIRVIPFQRLTP